MSTDTRPDAGVAGRLSHHALEELGIQPVTGARGS